ncbi:MAG: hypothetical protein JRN68_06440 [Nitrososphaerota archaeon]|nr:hypothetical protein [Nitrososphaerota archaeon]
MTKSDDVTETMVNQLLLDIKGFMIMQQSDSQAKLVLDRMVREAHDENVNRFIELVRKGRSFSRRGYVLIAVGEMILSALLIIGGLVLFAPAVAGLDVPAAVYDYFVHVLAYINGGGPLFLLTKVLEFVFAVVLLLSAVLTLRQASLAMKEAGLTIEPSG